MPAGHKLGAEHVTDPVVRFSVAVADVRDACNVSVVVRTVRNDASVDAPRDAAVDVTDVSYETYEVPYGTGRCTSEPVWK